MPKFRSYTQIPAFNRSLAEHLRSAGWAVYTEIPLGSATMETVGRADVLALKKSYSVRIVVYECKTSRSDYLRDVQAGKYERYFERAHQVYFAVPAGLVSKSEVPAGCGLIVRTEGSGWHVVKAGTVHNPEISPMLLLACLFREQEEVVEIRRLRERVNLEDNLHISEKVKSLGYEVARKLRNGKVEWDRINEAKAAIEGFLGKKYLDLWEAVGDLQRYIRDVKALEQLPNALELIDIAAGLVSPRGSFWRNGAKKRLHGILEKIEEGVEDATD